MTNWRSPASSSDVFPSSARASVHIVCGGHLGAAPFPVRIGCSLKPHGFAWDGGDLADCERLGPRLAPAMAHGGGVRSSERPLSHTGAVRVRSRPRAECTAPIA